ncbi:ATP-dependent DNA ligase [Ignisphaera sp. 4213-co]|uniref:DNA ligase n=1 Tax=Ignisphaera cupida TaxID=3050454 RepID=A0ABD4Z6X1_9CREN|nr:ATP-dependent DNA ligase [Ignisphaera sp. 4213-co]MDK6028663.1 ATP-dependent DNA ligase [Ignisphaera sp. 4213-co]
MEFSLVAQTLDILEKTSSKIQQAATLAALFKKTPAIDIDKVVYFILGILWPDWKGMPEIGIAEKGIQKAIAMATNTTESEVEKLYKSLGDFGAVVEKLKLGKQGKASGLMTFIKSAKEEKKRLDVETVYNTLVKIAMLQGEGSRDMKLRLLTALLMDADAKEAKYIVRFVEGRLRLGVGEATVMDGLATAFGVSRDLVERAYNIFPDLGAIAKTLAEKGGGELKNIKPTPGIPLRPMLAERGSDPVEILNKAGFPALAEFKYDGERAQIHKKGDKIWLFSRRLEEITHQYPDVVEMALKHIKASEAIVEGEIIAVDPETEEFKPFQELMHRKRKKDIHEAVKEIPVVVRLFDCLYVDGVDLTMKPLPERREYLRKIVEESDEFRIAEGAIVKDSKELEQLFLKAVDAGCEGLVVKSLGRDSVYQAGVRGWLWIKYKRDYKSELTDTVDLVVVGAFHGRGKRSGTYGALLLAAYDPDTDRFVTVCKVGTGFTDEELAQLPRKLEPYKLPNKHQRVDSDIEADVWFEPALVMEVTGAELTLSPVHTCCRGWVKPGVGISIRFPRFIRWREDKSPTEATTSKEIYEMYLRKLRKIERVEPKGEEA